jgi:hypothetical protein
MAGGALLGSLLTAGYAQSQSTGVRVEEAIRVSDGLDIPAAVDAVEELKEAAIGD